MECFDNIFFYLLIHKFRSKRCSKERGAKNRDTRNMSKWKPGFLMRNKSRTRRGLHTFPVLTKKKSRIRETKNLSTDADSSTNTKKILLVRQNSPAAVLTPFMSKSCQI